MDRSITVAGVISAVYYGRSWEVGSYGRNELFLFHNISNHDPATGDILHLAQSDALATELFRDGECGLGQPSRRGRTLLTERSDHSFVSLAKRPSVIVEQSKIALGVRTFL